MHRFAKINAAGELHMTELARLDDRFAAGRAFRPRLCKRVGAMENSASGDRAGGPRYTATR